MKMMSWGPEFELGIAKIDDQHKVILELINKTYDLLLEGNNDQMKNVFLQLIEYTKTHFTFEESLFHDNTNIDFEDHICLHQAFVAKVEGFLQNVEAGNVNSISDVLMFLNEWLREHILIEDKKYVEIFLASEKKDV